VTYVRSFEGYSPPPNYDDVAYVEADIAESESRDDGYAVLETIALTPDDDPSKPSPRNFTTELATLAVGWYRITWRDENNSEFVGTPVLFPTAPDWAPSVGDVAAHMRARTKVRGGDEADTFTEETKPTRSAVERLIVLACRRVSSAIGASPCNDDLRLDAGAAAAIYAAMSAEQSYYPEQTSNVGSSFQSLKSLWKDQITDLKAAVTAQCGTEAGGEGQLPESSFDDYGIIGRTNPPAW
jgi:hypothetical protein